MKKITELTTEEKFSIEHKFNKSKLFEIELFSTEPYIMLEGGTVLYIEGVQD